MLKRNSKKVLDIVAGQKKQNATAAYKEVHPEAEDITARTNAYKLMRKPEAEIYLQRHTNKAISTVVELMGKGVRDNTRLDAAKDILDRTYGKPTQRTEVKTTGITFNFDLTSSLEEELTTP